MDILNLQKIFITDIDSVMEFKSNMKGWKAGGRPFH
jgi:hypothetical protein